MIVAEDGETYGTIGGGSLERSLIEESLKTLKEGKSKKVTFNLTKSQKEGTVGTGMVCGGELTVLADVIEPAPRLIIVGTGHVALPLAKRGLVMQVSRYWWLMTNAGKSARSSFRWQKTFWQATTRQVLSSLKLGPSDFVVIANGEPEHDYAALRNVIVKDAAYVGLLGSKTKSEILTLKGCGTRE